MRTALDLQKEAVAAGYWTLYSYDPRKDSPLEVVSKEPKGTIKDFAVKQNRFNVLARSKPEVFNGMMEEAQTAAEEKFRFYTALAAADAKK